MKRECLLWSPDGLWLQTFSQDGQLRLSYAGRVSYLSAYDFAQRHHLEINVVDRPSRNAEWKRAGAKRTPVACAKPVERAEPGA